jgi:hypothetical protein
MKTPEGIVKISILQFLEVYSKKCPVMFWTQESVGIYDARLGGFRNKQSRFQKNGVADIIMIKNYYDLPIVIFFEVKSEKGRQSSSQKDFEKEINEINGFYFVVKSIDDVILCLEIVREKVESKVARVVSARGTLN